MTTVLGFDYGEKRIGMAIGNALTGTSRPLQVRLRQGNATPWQQLQEDIHSWQPERLLVGIPLTEDGARQPMTRKARRFAQELREQFQLPVTEVDERFSSCSASEELAQARREGRKNRRVDHGDIDSMAATLLVQQWLDSQ